MAIYSKKAKEIDVYIETYKCIKGKQKVEINGKIQFLESYMLPLCLFNTIMKTEDLIWRFKNMKLKLDRRLDPTDKEDVKKIKELLLQDAIEARKTYIDDLKQLGEQREVAAITHDGIVVNGNRRMATIEQLHAEKPTINGMNCGL